MVPMVPTIYTENIHDWTPSRLDFKMYIQSDIHVDPQKCHPVKQFHGLNPPPPPPKKKNKVKSSENMDSIDKFSSLSPLLGEL